MMRATPYSARQLGLLTVLFGVIFLTLVPLASADTADGIIDDTCDETELLDEITNATQTRLTFNCGSTTVFTLTSDLALPRDVMLDATGQRITITRSSSGGDYNLFTVNSARLLTLTNLTLTGGRANAEGGAIHAGGNAEIFIFDSTLSNNSTNTGGGAIRLDNARLHMERSVVISNESGNDGGAIHIRNTGTSPINQISDSVIANNSNTSGNGGGIAVTASSNLTIIRSGVYSNTATASGGGLWANDNSRVNISDSTFGNNTVGAEGVGLRSSGGSTVDITGTTILESDGSQPAIFDGGTSSNVYLRRSVVINVGGTACDAAAGGTGDFDEGNNLASDASCSVATTITAGTDISTTLVDNGGPSLTFNLVSHAANPAIDGVACSTTDQRGYPRPMDGNGDSTATCDIGAVEFFTPTVRLTPTTISALENSGTVDLTLQQLLPTIPVTVYTPTKAIMLGLNLVQNLASDFSSIPSTAVIPNTATFVTYTLALSDDLIFEGNERFTLTLTALTSTLNAIIDPTAQQSVITITEDEAAPTLVVGDATIAEGNTGTQALSFVVSQTTRLAEDVMVDYGTTDGTATLADNDYLSASGTVTIAANTLTTSFTVLVNGDLLNESDETFGVVISNVQTMSAYPPTIAMMNGIGTITNDDNTPDISISSAGRVEITGTMAFLVSLSAVDASANISVTYQTSDDSAIAGQDYQLTSGTLTIPSNTLTGTISVPVFNDSLVEGIERFTMTLSNPQANGISIAPSLVVSQATGVITDDDSTSISITDQTVFEGNSGTTDALFTVTLSITSSQTISVSYETIDLTAIGGSDFAAISDTLVFAPGQPLLTLTVAISGDTVAEPDETFRVDLSNPVNANIADSQGVGTIKTDDLAFSLPATAEVVEGNTLSLEVTLSPSSSLTSSVEYRTVDGTATSTTNYTATSGTLNFAAGQTIQTITIDTASDGLQTGNLAFTVELTNATVATIQSPGQTAVTLVDISSPPFVTISDALPANEGNSGTTDYIFEVSLSHVSNKTISVTYQTADNTALVSDNDYIAASGVLIFAPNELTKTFTVQVLGDAAFENSETFLVKLSNLNDAIFADDQGVGTINNDDLTPIISIDSAVSAVEGDTASLTVSLSSLSNLAVTVDYATADGTAIGGTDYTTQTGTLNFAPGTLTTQIVLNTATDSIDESNETFTVLLFNGVNASLLVGTQGTVTVVDSNAAPAISIADVTVSESSGSAIFDLSLTPSSSQPVTVTYATSDGTALAGSDYTPTSGTVIFATGQTSQQITVPLIVDAVTEGGENFMLNLSSPVNATLAQTSATVTINDDSSLPRLSLDRTTQSVSEENISVSFVLSLSKASAQTISITYTTSDDSAAAGSDYISQSGQVVYLPGEISQSITLSVLADTLDEQDEQFKLTLSNPQHTILTDSQATITIVDNDTASLSVADTRVAEGDSGQTTMSFTLTLDAIYNETVTVLYATANGTATAERDDVALSNPDYVSSSGQAQITAGQTRTVVAVTVYGDTVVEPDETILFNLSNASHNLLADPQAIGTIVNDDSDRPVEPTVSLASALTVVEGENGLTIGYLSATLSYPVNYTFTLAYSFTDGTATAGTDYFVGDDLTIVVPAGTQTTTIPIVVIGDLFDETDKQFTVSLLDEASYDLDPNASTATVTLADDDTATLSVDDIRVREGEAIFNGTGDSDIATFTITLIPSSESRVFVNYTIQDGTATSGADYRSVSGFLAFEPGEQRKTVTTTVFNNNQGDGARTFNLVLSDPVNAVISQSIGVATILDDDGQSFYYLNDAQTVVEGATVTYTVNLWPPKSDQPAQVTYTAESNTATAGSDYPMSTGLLNFPVGTTQRTVSIQTTDDVVYEADETYLLVLSNPILSSIAEKSITTTLRDNDSLSITVDDSYLRREAGVAQQVVFSLTLNTVSALPVQVTYATADGTAIAGQDYSATAGTAQFAAGETTTTVAVEIPAAATFSTNKTFSLNLTDSAPGTVVRATGQALLVGNRGTPQLSIVSTAVFEGDSGLTPASLTVVLWPTSTVTHTAIANTVQGTARNDIDFETRSQSFQFAPGETTKTAIVQVIGDTNLERDETFTVDLISNDTTVTERTGTVTIVNDDLLTAAIEGVTVIEGELAQLTVRLSNVSNTDLTFDYFTRNSTALAPQDYQDAQGQLTIAAGTQTQVISITTFADAETEGKEQFSVLLSSDSGVSLSNASATVTLLDPPTLSIGDVSVVESLTQTVEAHFIVSLSTALPEAVTVDYQTVNGTATAGADFTAQVGQLVFASGTTVQTITVSILADNVSEATEQFTVNLLNSTVASISDGQGMGTIQDTGKMIASVYLPVLLKNQPGNLITPTPTPIPVDSLPDLIVAELNATTGRVNVTIQNVGGASTAPFWVEVYLNPNPAPSQVNDGWPELAAGGLLWYVGDRSLAPNEQLTLSYEAGGTNAYYQAELSDVSTLAIGQSVYAQVDSTNVNDSNGLVLETHESRGASYNNISGPVTVTAPSADLGVSSVVVTHRAVEVVIINQGDTIANAPDGFWVDLYVAPSPAPSTVNQGWRDLSSQGIVWGVSGINLEVGQSLTLRYSLDDANQNQYVDSSRTTFSGNLATTTPIYVQVDSYDDRTTTGAVLEIHEQSGGVYNNNFGPAFPTASRQADHSTELEHTGDPQLIGGHLPPR